MSMWANAVLVVWVFGFFFAVIGLMYWQIKRRGTRPPLEFKLLRGPGESLRRRVIEFDENLLGWVFGAAVVPIGTGALTGWIVYRAGFEWATYALTFGFVTFCASAIVSGAWLLRRLHRRRNLVLGYLGERAVGEYLTPLLLDGYRIFHDVPAEGREKDFNLDHVTVGPTGVTMIETKTRRKGRTISGRKDHEVSFDGSRLIWPWGEDTHGIGQAIAQADWLRAWIEKRTGLKVQVKPILTLPGWWVNEAPSKTIRVVNAKILPDAVRGRAERVLSDEHIDLITRQLELVCRDVED